MEKEILLDIIDIDMLGRGIAHKENKTFFVDGALPGETIIFDNILQKNGLFFGKTNKIVKNNPKRIIPQCPYYSICGGCNLMHASYDFQLELKTKALENTLKKQLENIKVLPCVPAKKPLFYRNKAEFAVQGDKIGYFLPSSHTILELEKCLLCETWINDFLQVAKQLLKNNQSIVRIIARKVNNSLCLILFTETKNVLNITKLVQKLSQMFDNLSIFQNICKKHNNNIVCETLVLLYGKPVQQETINGVILPVSPHSFLQVNDCVKDELYEFVKQKIEPNNIIINAYSGAGFLTAILAQNQKKVYGLELDKSANNDANKLKKLNNIKNMENICGDCAVTLPNLVEKLRGEHTSFVVDPPRKGLAKPVIDSILKAKPSQIVYISCNPATLARDLKLLTTKYKIDFVQPFDMFPQTRHIETVVLMSIK